MKAPSGLGVARVTEVGGHASVSRTRVPAGRLAPAVGPGGRVSGSPGPSGLDPGTCRGSRRVRWPARVSRPAGGAGPPPRNPPPPCLPAVRDAAGRGAASGAGGGGARRARTGCSAWGSPFLAFTCGCRAGAEPRVRPFSPEPDREVQAPGAPGPTAAGQWGSACPPVPDTYPGKGTGPPRLRDFRGSRWSCASMPRRPRSPKCVS